VPPPLLLPLEEEPLLLPEEELLLLLEELLLPPLDELLLPLEEPLLLPEDELLPAPEELLLPASTTAGASHTTVMLLLLTSEQDGAPVGTVPSETVSVMLTVPAAVQVKTAVGLPPVPVDGANVPSAGVAENAQVSAPAFGPVDEPLIVIVLPTVVSPMLFERDVTRPQFEKSPPMVTLPASGAAVRQLAKAVMLAVWLAVTVNGAAAPVQVTVPSADVPLIVTVYEPGARPATVPRLIATVPSG
jgi:hypothetical protein